MKAMNLFNPSVVANYVVMIDNIIKTTYDEVTDRETYEKPQYGRNKISKAGRVIATTVRIKPGSEAMQVLYNWRAAHAFPLNELTNELESLVPDAIVVQRLKRLDSIINKLRRFPDMDLFRMQDLGGCRAIVESVEDVYNAVAKIKDNVSCELKRAYDYLQNPKTSGYRSYHLVFEYRGEAEYNKNILMEMQIRTKLQHVWATAVEVMGIYTKSELKSSKGNADVLRFFALASSLFAIMEGLPVVPGIASDRTEIVRELKDLDRHLNIISKISLATSAIVNAERNPVTKGAAYFLLVLQCSNRYLKIYSYTEEQLPAAIESYNKIELLRDSNINVVLVSAGSLNAVKDAYPNYFVDMNKFIAIIKEL